VGQNSEAVVAHEPASGGLPAEAERLDLNYFLEVFIARDSVDDWMARLDTQPALQQKYARLIEYAANDA
jgi:hypothetical protein